MKNFFTFMVLAIAAISMAATPLQPSRNVSLITGKDILRENMAATQIDVDTTATAATYSYHIENVTLEPDSLFEGAYKCVIAEFGNSFTEGEPAYPLRREIVELPFGCDTATVTITKASYVDIPCELAPAYPFWIGAKSPRFTKDLIEPISVSTFGSQNNVIDVYGTTTSFNKKYFEFVVLPSQYNSETKTTRIYTDIELSVVYGPISQNLVRLKADAKAHSRENFNRSIQKIISDPSPIDSLIIHPFLPNITDAVEDNYWEDIANNYIIVTTDKYIDAANDFAAFKRKMGFATHVTSKNSWTPSLIKDSIKAVYYSMKHDSNYYDENFYLLILGNNSDIPGVEEKSIYNDSSSLISDEVLLTDYYYGIVDNSQRLYVGRIPVNSVSEATSIINKIQNYIMNPTDDNRFYSTGCHIAVYDAEGGNSEKHGHIYGAEECRNEVMRVWPGKNISRLYSTYSYVQPYYYGANNSHENILPIELQKPNYAWDTDGFKIAEELDKGCFYALYRGHGFEYGTEINNFNIWDINQGLLTNRDKLPVFLNFTCLTGAYHQPGCFAETLLNYPTGGAIGVFAASTSTNCDMNNLVSKNLLSNCLLFSRHESYFEPLNGSYIGHSTAQLAPMLDIAFFSSKREVKSADEKYLIFHQKSYNLFGDPSLVMWTDKPREYTSDEVWCYYHYTARLDNSLKMRTTVDVLINLPEEACYIAIENKETHEVILGYGSIGTFPGFDPQKYSMTIYGSNRIPLEIKATNPNVPIVQPELAISPNPASTTCYIGYHWSQSSMAIISITSVSTGNVVDKFYVTDSAREDEVIGRIEMNVSKYPNGEYIVSFDPTSTDSKKVYHTTKKLIVQH